MVTDHHLIDKYFNLNTNQKNQINALGQLYKSWNEKINVVSRKDIDNMYLHHVLHSLSIAKVFKFQANSQLLDLGTGGGFPGIPLAIFFPNCHFTLIDGTAKKIKVVSEVAQAINLQNCTALHIRAENLDQSFHYILARAVAPLDKLWGFAHNLINKKQTTALPEGLITLKGGNLREEIKSVSNSCLVEEYPIKDYFEEAYFETKHIIYVHK